MQKDRPKVGIGCIVKRGDKILIGERTGNHGSGTWMIPGGHLEFGETFEECAIREAREESGLTDLRALGIVSLDNHVDYDKHYISVGVLLESATGEPTDPEPHKSKNWRWVNPLVKHPPKDSRQEKHTGDFPDEDYLNLPEPFFLPSKRAIENWLSGKWYSPEK